MTKRKRNSTRRREIPTHDREIPWVRFHALSGFRTLSSPDCELPPIVGMIRRLGFGGFFMNSNEEPAQSHTMKLIPSNTRNFKLRPRQPLLLLTLRAFFAF